MTVANKLLSDVEAFLSDTGMGVSYFGRLTTNSSALVGRLRSGRAVQPATEDKIRKFMSEHVRKERKVHKAVKAPKPVRKIAPSKPASVCKTPIVYVQLAKEMGVRIYTRPDGISLPYLRSLYGEKGA